MKEGYIVWNESSVQSEFFGVFRKYKQAEQHLRRIARTRLGHCPRDFDKMIDELDELGQGYDSYKITYFVKNEGEE